MLRSNGSYTTPVILLVVAVVQYLYGPLGFSVDATYPIPVILDGILVISTQ